jgi:hypothetical protein
MVGIGALAGGCAEDPAVYAFLDRFLARNSLPPEQPGALRLVTYEDALANPDGVYYMLRFELDDGQYATVSGPTPGGRYWSVVIYDLAGRPIDSLIDEEIIEPGMESFEVAIGHEPIGDLPTLIFPSHPIRRSGWVFVRVVMPDPDNEAPGLAYHWLD